MEHAPFTARRLAPFFPRPVMLTPFKLVVSYDRPEDLLKWPEMQYITVKMREGFANCRPAPHAAGTLKAR